MRHTWPWLVVMIVVAAVFSQRGFAAPTYVSAEALLVLPYSAAAPWKKITDHRDDKEVWIEWIPADQTEDDIKDILTEQEFFVLKGKDAGEFVSDLLGRIDGACRAASHNGPFGKSESGYQVAYAQAYCVGNQGKDVDIFIKAIAGHDALYVVQREFRRPATPGAIPGLAKFGKNQLPEAQARLAAQETANKFLTDQVKLCPNGISANSCIVASSAANAASPATSADSARIDGWPIPGKTSADDVVRKLGRPYMENHMDPNHLGQYSWVYLRNGTFLVFLFDKNDLVVRMTVHSAPHH